MTEDLRILCAGGFRAAMDLIGPAFEARSGHRLVLSYATPGRTRELLDEGFAFDAGVIVASVLAAYGAAPGPHFKLAVSPLGMGVPEAGPALSGASVAEVAASISQLESIGLSDPKAGTNVANEVMAAADRLGFGAAHHRCRAQDFPPHHSGGKPTNPFGHRLTLNSRAYSPPAAGGASGGDAYENT